MVVSFTLRTSEPRVGEHRADIFVVSPLSLLQNPMILIAVVGLGIVIGMPYLLDNSMSKPCAVGASKSNHGCTCSGSGDAR